jgi:hypothetical protein
MPPSTKQFDFNKLLPEGDVKVDLQVKTAEDADEKALRLKKEFLAFLVKDLGINVLAAIFVIVIFVVCLVMLVNPRAPADEKKWAQSAVSVILAGVVGIAFGKASK